ncbi:MAG: hypothetical protein Q9181_004589 [Wetmoreana brouardii]
MATAYMQLTGAQIARLPLWGSVYKIHENMLVSLAYAEAVIGRRAAGWRTDHRGPQHRRYSRLSVVAFPYYNKRKKQAEPGFACSGCLEHILEHKDEYDPRQDRETDKRPCLDCKEDKRLGVGAWWAGQSVPDWQQKGCSLQLAAKKLYTADQFREHIMICEPSQVYLQRNFRIQYVVFDYPVRAIITDMRIEI